MSCLKKSTPGKSDCFILTLWRFLVHHWSDMSLPGWLNFQEELKGQSGSFEVWVTLAKCFFKSTLIPVTMAKICWFLTNFSKANFHLLFFISKSYLKTTNWLSIIGFGCQRIPWVCLGFNLGACRAMKQFIPLSEVPPSGFFQTHLIDWFID